MFTFLNAIVPLLHCVYLIQSFHHILLDKSKYLMMQSSIWQMVRTRTSEDPMLDIPEGSVKHGRGQVPRGSAPPPPPRSLVSLEQLLATQNNLMRRLVENGELEPNASNLGIKRGILCTRIFWQVTCQSLPIRLTPWRQTAGSAPWSPCLGYFTI
jgi:hypothetical protein